jgi:hypothetical protein
MAAAIAGYLLVQSSPVRVSSRAAVEARVHAVAAEFDFVQPLGPLRRRVDKLRELRPDPFRQSGRGRAPARYRPRHPGSGEQLLCRRMGLRILAYPATTARRAPIVCAAS